MIEQAYISGQAGKALYQKDGNSFIAGLEDFMNPVECRPGDLSLYIESGADFVPLKEKELNLDKIKASLETKRNASRALTLAISGFNKELTYSTRSLCIEAAEELFQDEAVLFFVKSRLLARPLPEPHDIAGAIKVAENFPAPVISSLYREISESQHYIGHLCAAWKKISPDFFTLEPERQKVEKQLIDLGLFADMASLMVKGDFKNLGSIVVTYGLKPEIRKIPKGVQLINEVIKELTNKIDILRDIKSVKSEAIETSGQVMEYDDPIYNLILDFEQKAKKGKKKVLKSMLAKEKVDIQISAIEDLIREGALSRAQNYLFDLIKFNLNHGKKKYTGMTLCSLVKKAMDNNQIEFAGKLVDYACALNIEDVVISSTKAQFLKMTGRHDEALSIYNDAIKRFPNDEVAPTERAELLKEMGRHSEALEAYNSTITRFPNDEVAPNGRAELLKEMGRHSEALEAYNSTITRFPNDEVAPTGRAELLKEMGRYEEALEAYDNTIKRFPNNEVAPNGRAGLLKEMGLYEEALVAYNKTIKRFPKDEVAPNGRAELLKVMGRHKEALIAYDDAIKQFPNNEVAPNGRAELLKEMGRYDDALAAYDNTIKQFPNNKIALTGRIGLLILLGRFAEVQSQLFKGVPVSKQDWINYHISAMFYLKTGNTNEAMKMLEYGVENCPNKKSKDFFITALAFAKIKKKDFLDAVKTLESNIADLNAYQKQTCQLLLSHSQAEMGIKNDALKTLTKVEKTENRRIINLKDHLTKRYNLDNRSGKVISKSEIATLDSKIEDEEFFLIAA